MILFDYKTIFMSIKMIFKRKEIIPIRKEMISLRIGIVFMSIETVSIDIKTEIFALIYRILSPASFGSTRIVRKLANLTNPGGAFLGLLINLRCV